MNLDLTTFVNCLWSGLEFLPVTLVITFVPYILSLLLGVLFTIVYIYRVPFFGKFFQIYVYIMSGIPGMVILLIINLLFLMEFDSLMEFLHIGLSIATLDSIWIAIFALTVVQTNTMSQTIKSAFLAIDKGQYEAGYSVGLTRNQTMLRIIIPQVIPVAVPGMVNNLIGCFKGTSLVVAIGVVGVYSGCLIPCTINYRFLEGYLACAVIYWVVCIIFENIGSRIEKRQSRFRRNAV